MRCGTDAPIRSPPHGYSSNRAPTGGRRLARWLVATAGPMLRVYAEQIGLPDASRKRRLDLRLWGKVDRTAVGLRQQQHPSFGLRRCLGSAFAPQPSGCSPPHSDPLIQPLCPRAFDSKRLIEVVPVVIGPPTAVNATSCFQLNRGEAKPLSKPKPLAKPLPRPKTLPRRALSWHRSLPSPLQHPTQPHRIR